MGWMLPALMVGSSLGKSVLSMFNKPNIPKMPDYTHPYEKVGLRKATQMRMQTDTEIDKVDNRLKMSGNPESSINAILHKIRTDSNRAIGDMYAEYEARDIEAENQWKMGKYQNETQKAMLDYQHKQGTINEMFGGLMDAIEIYGLQDYRDQILTQLDEASGSENDLMAKIVELFSQLQNGN